VSELRRFALALALALAAAATAAAQEPRLQDPMRPPAPPQAAGAEGPDTGFSLTAVLVSASRRLAVVNGRIHREGDRINGEQIVAIEPGSILIRRGGTDVRVRVRNFDAVTTSNDGVDRQ
jgi:hypothetical protein